MNLKTSLLIAGGAAATLTLCACNKAATNTGGGDAAAVSSGLKSLEAQWNADYKAKDLAKIEAHYTADATLMAPGEPAATGTQAIHQALSGMLSDPALSLSFQSDATGASAAGDVGWTQGHFTITQTDPQTKKPMTQTGSYVTVYKKQPDGSWKAVEDIATPGPQAPSAKAG